jgi:hypothetical protein
VLQTARSGSGEKLQGEAAKVFAYLVCSTLSQKTANSELLIGLKSYQIMTSFHLLHILYNQACHLAE